VTYRIITGKTWPKLAKARRNHPGHVRGRMNSTERAYAEYLGKLKLCGEIIEYGFENLTLVLSRPPDGEKGRSVTWTPDFQVLRSDHTIELIDVKGGRPDLHAQQAKIRIAASVFWWYRFTVARRLKKAEGGGWQHEPVNHDFT